MGDLCFIVLVGRAFRYQIQYCSMEDVIDYQDIEVLGFIEAEKSTESEPTEDPRIPQHQWPGNGGCDAASDYWPIAEANVVSFEGIAIDDLESLLTTARNATRLPDQNLSQPHGHDELVKLSNAARSRVSRPWTDAGEPAQAILLPPWKEGTPTETDSTALNELRGSSEPVHTHDLQSKSACADGSGWAEATYRIARTRYANARHSQLQEPGREDYYKWVTITAGWLSL